MDHGGSDSEDGVAPSGSHRVAEAVASWRRDFVDADAIRPDDVDELCDHFGSVVQARLDAGCSFEDAVGAARSQVGRPDQLIQEMSRVQRPPRYYRRWCVALATYAVVQATLILAQVAGLGVSSYQAGITLPAQATWTYEVSAVGVLAGLLLIGVIARRFGLASAGRGMAQGGSVLASIAPIIALGIVLTLGLIFADYWQWWLQAGKQVSANPWDTVPLVMLVGMGGPVLALTMATILSRRHPALRRSPSNPMG